MFKEELDDEWRKTGNIIAGKTESEIISMTYQNRYLWYKTISSKEKEEAKKIVMIEKGRKIGIANVSRVVSKETRAKMSKSKKGKNHPSFGKTRSEETRAKQRDAWTLERRAEFSASQIGEKNHMYGKFGEDNPNFGSIRTEGTRTKQSEVWTPKRRAEQGIRMTDRVVSEETRNRMSGAAIEKWKDPEYKDMMTGENNPLYGKIQTEESNAKRSAALIGRTFSKETIDKKSGENHWNFKGWSSRKPYCQNWTEKVRRNIRDLCDRTCTICGKSTLQNKQRLSVDHLDENKMQGCDDWEWRLTALCHSCHSKMNKKENHLLLELLLLNNKGNEINFLFGDEV